MSAYSDLVLTFGPKGYYRFGEGSGTTLVDSSGNGRDGTYASGAPTWVTSAILPDVSTDQAVSWDGTSTTTFASVPDHADLDLGDGPFSILFWFKRGPTQSAVQTIIAKGVTGGNAYQIRFNGSNVLQFLRQGGSSPVNAGTITDQVWHFGAVTRSTSGTTTKFYLDGADASVAGTAQTLTDSTNPLRFLHTGASVDRAPMSLDEVAIIKGSELSAANILALWEAGQGIIKVSIPAVSITGEAPPPVPSLGVALPAGVADALAPIPTSQLGISLPAGVASGDSPPVVPSLGVTLPAAAGDVAAPAVTTNIAVAIPAAALDAVALAPATALEAGLPPASVAGTASGGADYEQPVPAGVVDAAAPPPTYAMGDVRAAPAAEVSAVAPPPTIQIDSEMVIPPASISVDSPPPSYVVGDERFPPAAEITAAAPPPTIQIDAAVSIPAAIINAVAPPPSIPGVGDDGATGGGFPVRRAPKRVPGVEKSVMVKIPAAAINGAAAEPDYYLTDPDEDLAILLLYGT